jgi:ATP-dependent DNA ligase
MRAFLLGLIRPVGRHRPAPQRASGASSLPVPEPSKPGLEGIVSKRLGSRYVSGRSRDWLKFKNPEAPAVKREAEEEWGR